MGCAKYLLQLVVPGPSINQGHSRRVVVPALALGQKQQLAVGNSLEAVHCGLPECKGNVVRRIKAESVDSYLKNPELHLVNHGGVQSGVCVVQVSHIEPIGSGRMNDASRCIGGVPLGVLGNPWVVPGSVVGNPINDDRNFALVGLGDQRFKVFHAPKLGINGPVISHTIGRSHRFKFAHFEYRHKPKGVDMHGLQPIQVGSYTSDGARGRVGTRVHFIEQEVLGVYHVGQRIPGLGFGVGAAGISTGECRKGKNSS